MAIISLEEMKMLRDVLITLTNLTTKTKETLSDFSNGVFSATDTTQRIRSEIDRLELSIKTTNSLVSLYERHLREESNKGAMERHTEEAKIITDAFRSLLHVNEQFPMPAPNIPEADDIYRRANACDTNVPVPFSGDSDTVDPSGTGVKTMVRTQFLSRVFKTTSMPHTPAHLPLATVSSISDGSSVQILDRAMAPSTKPAKRDGKGTRRQNGRKTLT